MDAANVSRRERVAGALATLRALPPTAAKAGPLSPAVLERMVALTLERDIRASAETGSGLSTLLLSQVSCRHVAFTAGPVDGLLASPVFRPEAVELVIGSTQLTLPSYRFEVPLDLVLLDGPHAYPFPDLEYYHLYPHLAAGGLLIVDDIDIASVHNLFCFLREDAMFRLDSVVSQTAFFVRTEAPAFPRTGDGWEGQAYNRARHPLDLDRAGNLRPPLLRALSRVVPGPLRRLTRGWPSRWLRRLTGQGR